MATMRYLVTDVAAAVDFYVDRLRFTLVERFGPAMAIVRRDDLVLWLAGPASSAARAMPDGQRPGPGGWNRVVIETDDLDGLIEQLRASGAVFRNDVVVGPGGRQILVEDPSGNVIELFEAASAGVST
jgi:catechol 2,3-dioxygenase-like lactoylglutathione lyase family enzyme